MACAGQPPGTCHVTLPLRSPAPRFPVCPPPYLLIEPGRLTRMLPPSADLCNQSSPTYHSQPRPTSLEKHPKHVSLWAASTAAVCDPSSIRPHAHRPPDGPRAGLFLGPQMTGEALKGGRLAAEVMSREGFQCVPAPGMPKVLSMITAIGLGSRKRMSAFCRGVQSCQPIGSYIQPVPGEAVGTHIRVHAYVYRYICVHICTCACM